MQSISVSEAALKLSELGYHVVPITQGSKACSIPGWQQLRISPQDVPRFFKDDADPGMGLLLGTEVAPGLFLTAIDVDIDDDVLIERIRYAFGTPLPAKFGSKGITFFCTTTNTTKKQYLQRKDPLTERNKTVVEILALGQQTVIPPTLHPNGREYVWVPEPGETEPRPLYGWAPQELPVLTNYIFSEIEAAVKQPDSPIFLINDMYSNNGEGGGTVHNSVLAAVASMVGRKWPDEVVWQRASRAIQGSYSRSGCEWREDEWYGRVAKMSNDARIKGFDAAQAKKDKPWRLAAGWILHNWRGSGNVFSRDGQLAAYDTGYYMLHDVEVMKHILANQWPEPGDVSFTSRDWLLSVQTALDMAKRFPAKPPNHRVCFRNGTFDMDDDKFNDWDQEDFLISQLPFEFDPKATCPVYDKFIYRALVDDDPDETERAVNCFEEYAAHTLFECLDYHKFMVIRGRPRTGKSTLTHVISMMHDPKARAAVPMEKIGDEKYLNGMIGKLVNITNEVSALSKVADGVLKQIVAGDPLQIRFLYCPTFEATLPTRLVLACNEMFQTRDTSNAVEARMIIIKCDREIPQEHRDIRLKQKLEAETPGIFNRMVKAWHRLWDRGYFLPPRYSEEELSKFSVDNNHVLHWFKTRTFQGARMGDPTIEVKDTFTETPTLYLDYSEWSKMMGFKPISVITFGTKLSQINVPDLDINPKSKRVGGRVIWARPISLMMNRSEF